ncbi:YidH family protein [Swaminathania salitolerans]|uniref:DUF202 domain-containing protein n=1 Tax=Swaminathania salitolerans TaxID=182838 RepID=A0A511BTR5_9PROT|nr:DUF202 domain-containing protein [Swaminathania salitolerans]GBQ12833.1 hypothetical protein AA21291_1315 [Swaminathania salitolerans LMG 21291]GEL03183.1 hypothetical protein SSA02_23460 [Swaminathania salitolerans]
MIARYTDHAANERTFLAWVRTALAMVAIGCMLAKLNIFLRLIGSERHVAMPSHPGASAWIGVATICAGLALLPASWWRFRQVKAALSAEEPRKIALSGLEGVFCLFLCALIAAILLSLLGWLPS